MLHDLLFRIVYVEGVVAAEALVDELQVVVGEAVRSGDEHQRAVDQRQVLQGNVKRQGDCLVGLVGKANVSTIDDRR